MNTLHISHLGKTYANGVCALRDVSLTISDGMFGLLGANGAGKSSLMRTIAGLQTPDTGTITFNGIDTLANPLHIKACLGYLPQEFGVYPNLYIDSRFFSIFREVIIVFYKQSNI